MRVTSATDGLDREFTAEGDWQEVRVEAPRGEHTVTVSVSDEFGNETVEKFTATVTAPIGAAGVVGVVLVMALLAGIGLAIRALVRHGRRRTGPAGDPGLALPPPPA